ncbi:hypothetical protein H5410_003603 [Solanum commersonii]|uniref:Polyprotein protein n=1 Tax=Solanum commersonii TaxID=4109 RepID=A0A9J6B560_SOLCO|nr:hypothetical protein H5410_003603 [Solanum commersonii]
MLLKMGHLAHSADVRATRLEAAVLWMIEATILLALTPLGAFVDNLTVRVTTCESRQGDSSKVMTLRAEVADLRKDVDYLKSIDFTTLFKATETEDAPATSDIPSITTGDVQMDDIATDESEAETDEEQIEIREKSIYRDLSYLEKTIV